MELEKCKCGRPLLAIDEIECEVCVAKARRYAFIILLTGVAVTIVSIAWAL